MSGPGIVRIETGTLIGCVADAGGWLSHGCRGRPAKWAEASLESKTTQTANAANRMEPPNIRIAQTAPRGH
jgi:hypothetical protein